MAQLEPSRTLYGATSWRSRHTAQGWMHVDVSRLHLKLCCATWFLSSLPGSPLLWLSKTGLVALHGGKAGGTTTRADRDPAETVAVNQRCDAQVLTRWLSVCCQLCRSSARRSAVGPAKSYELQLRMQNLADMKLRWEALRGPQTHARVDTFSDGSDGFVVCLNVLVASCLHMMSPAKYQQHAPDSIFLVATLFHIQKCASQELAPGEAKRSIAEALLKRTLL